MSRKITAHLFNSVNGVVEDPHLWQFDGFGPEEGEAMGAAIAPVTDVVIGRRLWEEWKDYWPAAGADDPFAEWINAVPKHVISSTLSGDLPWNSTLITGDPLDHVRDMRESDGGDISVAGGIDTIRSLFLAGLVDRLTLTTHPVAAAGRRLFDESVPTTRLSLVDATTTSAGNVMITYSLRPED